MEIRVYDKELNFVKLIDVFDSFLWNEKYNDVGEFQLTCSKGNFKYLQDEYRITNSDDLENVGIIEKVGVTTNERTKEESLVVTGRFAAKMLEQRIIMKGAYRTNIEPADYVELLIDRNAINPEGPERKIENLQFGTKVSSDFGTINYNSVYTNLLTVTKNVLQTAELGFKIALDTENKVYRVNIYKGLNRSQNQQNNASVILSKSLDNVATSEYERNTKNYRNVLYIKGEGEFKTEITFGNYSGINRKEMFIDLTSTSRTLGDGTILDDIQYAELLQQQGVDNLKRAIKEELLYNSLNLQSRYKYKKHFDVGDVVTCSDPDLGFSIDVRIMGVTQSWDRLRGYSLYLDLGETKISIENMIDRIILTDRQVF